jgi:hypothetical protein
MRCSSEALLAFMLSWLPLFATWRYIIRDCAKTHTMPRWANNLAWIFYTRRRVDRWQIINAVGQRKKYVCHGKVVTFPVWSIPSKWERNYSCFFYLQTRPNGMLCCLCICYVHEIFIPFYTVQNLGWKSLLLWIISLLRENRRLFDIELASC